MLICCSFTKDWLLFENEVDLIDFQQSSLYYWILAAAMIAGNIFLILFVYLVLSKEETHPLLSYFTMPHKCNLVWVLATFICLIFFMNGFLQQISTENKVMDGLTHNVLGMLNIFIFSTLANEICFRRGILGSLLKIPALRRYALVISAVLSAFYGVWQNNPAQMLGSFVLGLFFGWLYIRTKSLTLPIICHLVNNFIGIVVGLLLGQGTTLADCFPNAFSFYIAMGILAIAGSIFFRISQKKIYKAPSFSE